MFGNRRLKALKWAPASARWLPWTFAPHPPQKVRPSVKRPLIVEPAEGLEISKQAPASTFVLHPARDWPQFHTRRASRGLQRIGTRVAPGRTQGQGGCSGYEQNDYTPPRTTLAEVQKKEHRSVQVAVARYCEKLGNRGVVIVHNSGQEVAHGHREECLEWLNVRKHWRSSASAGIG